MATDKIVAQGSADDGSLSRKLIESFVMEDSMATNLAQQSSPATVGAPAAAPAANGSGGPILLQYANYLGMDVVADSDLLWIAQQALTAELPPGWTEHADPTTGDNYYHNAATGETVWEHPCDAYYRDLYAQLKSQKQQRAEETGAVLPANLAALSLPANRYLDPIRKKAESQERKMKKGEERQKLREERIQRNALKRAQKEKRAAKKLQRMWKARQFRRSLNAFMQEKKAAVMVQARIRGILFRRRTREALIAQIENIAITKLQAAVRGNLLRNQVRRSRAIKRKREEAAKAAREEAGAKKLVAKLGHVAFLERVGLRPTESSNNDGSLGTDSYSQMYAVNKLQAAWRGKQGRRRAEERAADLRAEYAEMMLAITAAKTVQRIWRRWRYKASASVSIPVMQTTSSDGQKAGPDGVEDEEHDLVDAPRSRALDSLFSQQFPQFSAVLESHREGRGAYQEHGSCSAKIVAERMKRLDNMGVRLIWITADLCEKRASKNQRAGNRWKQGAKKAGAKGTIGGVLAAAKAETSGEHSFKPSERNKPAPQGGDEGANKMACHFFRKGEPLVALRYLRQDALANSAGFVDSEYKLAVNLSNTASIFVQPPICNEKRFDEALKFTDRAIQTLNSHAETATLASAKAKAAVRRMELAVCVHNVGVHFIYAGRVKEAWQVVEEAHKCLEVLPADLRTHPYFTAITKSFCAMDKLSLSMGIGSDSLVEKTPTDMDEKAGQGQVSGGQRVSPGAAPEHRRAGRSTAATIKAPQGVRHICNEAEKETPRTNTSKKSTRVKFIVSQNATSGMLPALNGTDKISNANSFSGLAHASDKSDTRGGPGPIAKLQQKIRESKQAEESGSAAGVYEVKGAAIQSLQASNLLASMTSLTRAMVQKTKG